MEPVASSPVICLLRRSSQLLIPHRLLPQQNRTSDTTNMGYVARIINDLGIFQQVCMLGIYL